MLSFFFFPRQKVGRGRQCDPNLTSLKFPMPSQDPLGLRHILYEASSKIQASLWSRLSYGVPYLFLPICLSFLSLT